jgi:hypothetical protein
VPGLRYRAFDEFSLHAKIFSVDIEVREAKTGTVLDVVSLYGSGCPETVACGTSEVTGSSPKFDDFIENHNDFVTANSCDN